MKNTASSRKIDIAAFLVLLITFGSCCNKNNDVTVINLFENISLDILLPKPCQYYSLYKTKTGFEGVEYSCPFDERSMVVRLGFDHTKAYICLLYTSPSPRDKRQSRMPSSA